MSAAPRAAPIRPIALQERERLRSLMRIERIAVIPAKWSVLVVTIGLWLSLLDWGPDKVLISFLAAYALINAAETAWLYFREVPLRHVRAITFASYLVDVFFVTGLIYLDTATRALGERVYSSFYILCFLAVMRGFVLFRSMAGAIVINLFISFLFVFVIRLQQTSFAFITEREFAVQLILIWLVILMIWFLMLVYNEHRIDLDRVQARLMRSENLATVGELAASVAHEINNPLGVISSTTEYLRKRLPADDESQEDLEAIYRESNRCKETVQQLLVFARPKADSLTLIDARALANEVLTFIFPRGRRTSVEIATDYSDAVPLILADPSLLKQALLNLYLNARQAMGEDRPGRIVTRIHPRRRTSVVIEIADTGPGIPPEVQERIFEPFFSTRDTGTGLGLATTQRIVESMGGTISVESSPGAGATFRLEFPFAETDAARPASGPGGATAL